ncbi:anaphase-promoting complex subunit 1-like isoform X2 [Pipistrellus kuhlii]|uniref:anaphase-promoting complex subunit 1-like isoform X2 n=1 Tax=Pipistrellus kuhlii TaxID=59472 RepID=UPI00174EFE5B|nr:anaphase-promoting complex subunit 1-like isoform X2 [Pipistrellus kuhlii]
MLFLLHQVFEEPTLNTLMGEGIHSLVDLLVQLARDLKWEFYLDHYYRDHTVLFRTTEHVCSIDRDCSSGDSEAWPPR